MKNIRKHKILAWILAAVLMITSCPASVFADAIPTESGTEQQAVLTEGGTESSETVIEEAPAEGTGENEAAEADSSQSEDVGSETVQENQEESEQAESEQAEAPKEEQTASKEEPAKAGDSADSGKASAAKAPAAKTDSSEAKDEVEEEEGGEAPLVGAPPVALTAMTRSLSFSATPSENVGRGDSISLAIAFALHDMWIPLARDADYWTYDLSTAVGEGQTILSLNDGDEGTLYQGATDRGHYEVHGTELRLYVDKAWLRTPFLRNVSGTFNLSANLNEDANASKDEAEIQLPGAGSTTITFEERKLETSKKVGTTPNALSEQNDGGRVQVEQNADGSYTLYYSITAKPNVKQSTFSVSDTLGGGQMLNTDSLKLKVNGQETPADFGLAQNGNGFTLNLGSADANSTYEVTYSTTITADQLGTNQTNDSTWNWDKEPKTNSTNVTPAYDYVLDAYKKAGNSEYNLSEKTGGASVELTEKNEDGTYNIWYSIEFRANKNSSTLLISDTMSGGQTFDASSLKVYANSNLMDPQPVSAGTDSGFSINMNGADANVWYTIKYKTTVTEDQIEEALRQTNSAAIDWDGEPVTVTTDLTPTKKTVEPESAVIGKSIISGVSGQSAKAGSTVEYKITIGKDGGLFDYAGMKVEDSLQGQGKEYVEFLPESFSISPAVEGGTFVPEEGPGPKLFTYTFPTDGEYTGKYEITYQVKLNEEGIPAGTWINNKGKIGEGPGAKESSTGFQVTSGDPASLEKEATEWDLANNTIYWTVTITVPDGTTVNDSIQDKNAEIATDSNFTKNKASLTIQGSQAEITYEDGTPVPADVISMDDNGNIRITGLTRTAKIKVPTVADTDLSDIASRYGVVYAHNTAEGNLSNSWQSKTATDKYTTNEYEMTKTGTIDENGVASWTVTLNPRKAILDPDHVPYFTDTLPSGMELDGKVKIVVEGVDSNGTHADWTVHEREETVTPSGGVIGPIALNQFNGATYAGLSGLTYTITYKTKLTADEMNKVRSTKDTYTYTNSAAETTPDGGTLKTASYPVEYIYTDEATVTKEDTTGNANRGISYRITVNESGAKINGGNTIHITDRINTNVSLTTNTVKVTDPEGNELASAIIGYNDDSRILEVLIPDETPAIITFSCRPLQKGTQEYSNTVTVQAAYKVQDSVAENHRVTDTGGTITGEKNTITLSKIDQYNLQKTLPDAQFELYECVVDDSGIIESSSKVSEGVTEEDGSLVFSGVRNNTLYYWKEIAPPAGYLLADEPHYFITYAVGRTDAETAANRQAVWDMDDKITAANGITVASIEDQYFWLVTDKPDSNAMVELKGEKTLTGRDMEDGEFEFVLQRNDSGYPLPEASETVTVDAGEGTATVKNAAAADGETSAFDFGSIKFTREGTYYYTITEKEPSSALANITYDKTVYDVKVDVTLNEIIGILVAEVTYTNSETGEVADSAVFNNEYAETTTTTTTEATTTTTTEATTTTTTETTTTTTTEATTTTTTETTTTTTTEATTTTTTEAPTTTTTETTTTTTTEATTTTTEAPTTTTTEATTTTTTETTTTTTTEATTTTTTEATTTTTTEATTTTTTEATTTTTTEVTTTTTTEATTTTTTEAPTTTTTETTTTTTTEATTTTTTEAPTTTTTETTTTTTTEATTTTTEATTTTTTEATTTTTTEATTTTTTQSYVVNKVDAGSGDEVDGAVIALYEKDDAGNLTPIERWVSVSGETHDFGDKLEAGHSYVLRETTAPTGYGKVTTDIEISISADGELTSSLQPSTQDDGTVVYLIEDSAIRFNVNKTDVANGEELDGAVLTVFEIDAAGNEKIIDSWTSAGGMTHDFGTNLEAGKSYVLREETAPTGYQKITTDIAFTVNEDGTITTGLPTATDSEGNVVYLVQDSKLTVKVSKVDVADGKEIAGARIQLYDERNQLVDEWTSSDTEAYVIEGIQAGITYTLKETIAPEGYAITSDTTFSIDEEGNITSSGTVSEEGVILIEDGKTSVSVSKVDAADGKEVAGATIQVIDSTGKVVDEWTSSDKEAHMITGLKTGVEYTLKETVAPDGYTIASETTFSLDEDGKVTSSGTVTTDGVLLIEDAKTKVKVSKTDIADGKELAGATIQILDADGNVVEINGERLEWVSGTEAYEIEGLKTGTEYTLKETVAPDGYAIASETTFTIDETGKVTSSGTTTTDSEGNEVLLVEDAKTKVKVSKTDIADGAEIEGATIQILNKDGNVVDEWTSGTEAHEIEGLKTNEEYTLKETVAPDGYTIASETTFKIDETGKVTSTGTVTEDGVLLVEDAKTKVKVSKTDIADGAELEGATIQILDADGNVVEINGEKLEWTSGTEAKEIEGLKTGVEYTLKETVAPEGYTIASETTFTIDETGKVTTSGTTATDEEGNTVMLIEDAKTKVKVSKTDIADGAELPGATIQILDADGNVAEINGEKLEWTSGTEAKEIEGLKTGVEYTLKETVAPDGYTIANETTFTIDETGKVTTSGTTTTDEEGNTVMLVEDAKTKIKVSKTDIADGKELAGATIQILDENGDVVIGWVSGTEAHEIEGLKTGVTYVLKEVVAPEGYTIASQTTFTIDETGKVTTSGATTTDSEGNTVMLVEDAKTKVKVSKTDIADGAEIEGATIQILDKDGNIVDEWTSGTEAHEIEGLKTNEEYTLKETVAPEGYTLTSETTFTIDETGKVTSTGTVTEDGVVLVEDAKTKVKVSKTDIADGAELEGATIQILDKDGNIVEEWTSGTEAKEIEGLKTGVEYTLKETVAPDGYTIASETTFTIDETGKVTSTGTVTEDGVMLVEDAKTKVKVSKTDIVDGAELEGATIQILDKDGNIVEEWTSGTEAKEIEGLKTGVEYTLKETVAPDGYTIASETTFTIDETGKVTTSGTTTTDEEGSTVMLIEDAKTKVKVSKTDIADGKELAGATIQILDENGDVVIGWISGTEAHEIEGLKRGVTYVVNEVVARYGYTIESQTTFTIDETGKVTTSGATTTDSEGNTVMLVEDAKTKVKVSKTDIADGAEIEGATIQILDKDGNIVDEWTSGTEAHEIEGLKTNEEYTLKETVAPEGYTIASETTFTIDETGKVTSTGTITEDGVLLVEDAKTKVKVSKTDIADGAELEGATIQILDKDGNVVDEWTSTKEAHEIEGLKTNEEYTLKETVAPDGYTIASETTFTIDETGKVTSTGTVTEDGVMLVEDAKTKVKVSKTDIVDGAELEGATIQILDKDGNIVEEWTSGTEAKEIEGLKTGVEYTLKETVAPDGYTIASETTFTIDETGKVTSTGTVTEDGVMLVEDAKTKMKVSKTDIADGAELEGATIQILDKDGNVVDEWTSGTEAHEIEGLKTGVEYTLKETVAPDGYTIASETTFTIDETGKVTSSGTISNEGILLVEDAKTSVKVSKVDVADGKEVAGATIQVLDADGNVVDEWTSSDTEAHMIEGLKTGVEYTLKETVAPEGYTIATETTFSIDELGKVTSSGTVTMDGVLLVEDAKTKVKVSKTDIADGAEIEGATIQILDKDGNVVEEWTSGTEAHEIEGLKTGEEYTLKETVAPDGYTIASETTFTIDETGKVTSTGTVTEDGVMLVEDAKTKVKVSKTDIADGAEIEGATIQILDENGDVVIGWISGTEAHEIEGLKTGVTYVLKEVVAPEGYTIASQTTFTIDETGKVTTSGATTTDSEGNTVMLVEDAKTKVKVSKTDIADGAELEGATIQILDKDGNVVDEWTSTKEAHEIEGLKTNEEYTLKETVAPDGYTIASETTFTIDETGKVTSTGTITEDGVMLVEDAKTKVKVSKTDIADGEEIEGATIQIINKDGNVVEEWTSGTEAHEIEGLKTGEEYTLKETVAPDGYTIAAETTFTIDETGKVTSTGTTTTDEEGSTVMLVEDAKTKVKVSKTDIADGAEIEGATIQILDENGDVVIGWVSGTEAHEIEGLKTGVTYVLKEVVAPEGYTIASQTTFTIDETGKVTTSGTTTTDSEGNTVMLVEDAKTKVKVSKTDIADGAEIEGATIQILDKDGNVVDEWTSTKEAHEIEGLKTNEEYTLKETVAPDGYTIASETTFTIDETGKVTSTGTITEDGVMLVEDAKTKVKVSKTDIADGEEIEGATIQILDKDGNVVEEWTSGTEAHEIEGLKTNEEYTLKETVAPDGYTIASETKFTIDETGKVTSTGTITEDGVMLVEDAKTKVKVSKTDIADGAEIEGATIQILDTDGNVVEINGEKLEWTSGTEAKEIEGLKTGVEYTLKETVAPDGYTIASETTFTIDETGKVTSTGTTTTDSEGNTVMLVEDAKTKVKVSKTDIADGAEIAGATIQILDKDGNVVEEWTSTTEAHEIEGLKTDEEYTLKETVAPDGYTIASETTFTIDETGKVTSSGTTTTDAEGNTVMLVEDAKTKVKVSKTDIADGKELEGATIQILDADGNVVEEWISGTEAHEIEGLKTGEEYTLKETVAPDGYAVAAETTFTIDETGKVTSSGTVTTGEDGETVMLVEDAKTKVTVAKVDKSGKALEGAKLQIVDKSGKTVDEWTTGKDVHTVEGLNPGEYTLKETAAPSGYQVAAPIAFTLEADGTVRVNGKAVEKITMIDEKVTTTTTRSGGPSSGSSKASTTGKSSAKTGDTNNVLPFALMAAISAGAIAGVTVKKKKEDEDASEEK